MTTFRTLPSLCPTCGEVQDALTSMKDGDKPDAGYFTVCWKCGEICTIDEGGKREKLSHEEFKVLPDDFQKELLTLQNDARAGKVNPYNDGKSILGMVEEGWSEKFMGPFTEAVAKGYQHLREACIILDKACAENTKDVPSTIIADAIECCRAAMIDLGFEFTPEAEFIRQLASKITEGPKRGWQ